MTINARFEDASATPAIVWDTPSIRRQLQKLDQPGSVVSDGTRLGVTSELEPLEAGFKVVCRYPALAPSALGDPDFLARYDLSFPYMAGAMANGIASPDLVIALAQQGFLASYGAGGVRLEQVDQALAKITSALQGAPFSVNLIHSPSEPAMENGLIDILLRYGVTIVEASAFMGLTPALVRYRALGLRRREDGSIDIGHRLIAKVSRSEVASVFMEPAPENILKKLLAQGAISEEQAALAAQVPIADDITAEADSGGQTDRRPLVVLLPIMLRQAQKVAEKNGYAKPIRIGVGGGLGSPKAIAAAFATGAAYVVTGSVNQACQESGSSPSVRALLAKCGFADTTMAPAADMFELGVELQVLKRGTLFASRAKMLYDLYRRYDSLDALPEPVVQELEQKLFKQSLADVWRMTADYFVGRDPKQVTEAEADPKRKMALVFRAYLGKASHWANAGEEGRQIDYQIWSGPAIGDFNEWTAGTYLEQPESRRVVDVATHLLQGAAFETRLHWLAMAGVRFPHPMSYEIAPL
ncbi:PfaD family polyunsaturated fatty acid/polyketide biosynthesis protein [Agrobacterium vitis]|uniref:PfaD family polyunsaturated fatty acid/polyketide biosynthesis protein n=1 Tax=Agrobacterium vitis TaxID=373 RepID=UPI0012E992CB|nr:PfaD family polyunsaturated fatty acid/polyketide biosynthesis protein [Agrobacterium vitis]MVA65304.1 PfaD family polyunsaturated fatty acid/polyketide biosynthesis protein [Agrobacterium vitis]MVA86319.1 PfaD family polyunsaturated fatty acid/polyketide biosynthesis protein [Agrobacterium vitis]